MVECRINFNENGAILKVPEKLLIVITNPLVCYLIIRVNCIRLLLINKLIFIDIIFKISKETSCTYNGPIKPRKKIRPGQHILR